MARRAGQPDVAEPGAGFGAQRQPRRAAQSDGHHAGARIDRHALGLASDGHDAPGGRNRQRRRDRRLGGGRVLRHGLRAAAAEQQRESGGHDGA